MPGNADYHEVLAEHLEGTGVSPDGELQMVTQLDPRESRYWIRRSFRAEVEQKLDEAERYLIEAHKVDNGFDPRWALMNYYFRRGRNDEFWKYAREAFSMLYGDPEPVFRLCLLMNDDPSRILPALQGRRDLLFFYFQYFTGLPQLSAAAAVAPALALRAETAELPQFISYCNQQIPHDTESAVQVWNSLCKRHLLPFQELSPAAGGIVTNPGFMSDTLKQGFDWKYESTDAATVRPAQGDSGLSIGLAGQQPERMRLLQQPLPLAPGMRYQIDSLYDLDGEPGDTGLRWAIYGMASSQSADSAPLVASAILSSSDGGRSRLTFSSEGRNAVLLVLEYRRTLGTVRWKGNVLVHSVTSALLSATTTRETVR